MSRRVVAMLVAVFAAASFAGSVSAAPAKSAPSFRHVIVVFFENKEYGSIIGSSSAPRFNRLAKRYALMTRFHGVTHPSLPNYIAFVSGSTQGIDSNCTRCSVDARSLADTIEESGRTWKTYAEGLPSPGFTGATSGRYAKKHNPFLYFDPVLASQERRERVVPYDRFKSDLAAGSLPDFSLVIPDMCNSMHDCSVRTGDQWLSRFIDPAAEGLPSPGQRGVRDVRRGEVGCARRRAHRHPRSRADRQARLEVHGRERPLRAPAHDRGRLATAPSRQVGPGKADHRDLEVAGSSPATTSTAAPLISPERSRPSASFASSSA